MRTLDRLRRPRPYRGFTLVSLSHLDPSELYSDEYMKHGGKLAIKETAFLDLKERIEAGKRIIDENSKRGDLVMLEGPEEWTYESFARLSTKITPELWEALIKHAINMNNTLARYAESRGRKALSLEPSVSTPTGKLTTAMKGKGKESPLAHPRLAYLIFNKRNLSFQRKIQLKKPALVIVALDHAIYLYHAMKPKNVIWEDTKTFPKSIEKLAIFLKGLQVKRDARRFYKAKKDHRKQAAKEKGLKFKRIKRPRA